MLYVIRCQKCTGPEIACDELRDDQRCPKCGSIPSTYEVRGERYCWLHRKRMADSYPVSAFFLTTVYAWRGHSHRFPNAKLFQAGTESGSFGESPYCASCQQLYDEFLAEWRADQKQAEPIAAANPVT